MTALNGALERLHDGRWYWKDGDPEPRVRDMRLSDVAPNFRCVTYGDGSTYVEIPAGWRQRRYWPNARVDEDAASAIEVLLVTAGEPAEIYGEGPAEMMGDHRLRKPGHLVPVEAWDACMNQVVGAWWDKAHEADILGRANTR